MEIIISILGTDLLYIVSEALLISFMVISSLYLFSMRKKNNGVATGLSIFTMSIAVGHIITIDLLYMPLDKALALRVLTHIIQVVGFVVALLSIKNYVKKNRVRYDSEHEGITNVRNNKV